MSFYEQIITFNIPFRDQLNFTSLFVTTKYSRVSLYHFPIMSCLFTSPLLQICASQNTRLSKVTCSAKIITQTIKVTQSTARCFYETLWQLNQNSSLKQCGDFLKNWKQNCHMTQQSHFWAHTPRKPDLKETRAPQCSSQHCLSQPGHESNLDAHQQMNR